MAAYLVIGGQNRGVYSSLDEIPFNIPPQAPLPIIIECWGEANVSQLDAISSAVEEAGAKLVSGTTWTAKDHREAVTAIIQKEESLSATLAETPWSQHSKFYALLNSPKQRNFIALEYKSVLPFLMDTRKGEYRILTFPTFIRAVVWTLAQGNTNLNNWGPDFSEWVGHARGPATNGPGGPLRPIPNDENSDEQGDFRRTVKATINIHSTHFRIYDITVPALQMKFEVKKGSGSPYDGTLYYNRVEDIKPNSSELATTGSLDGCLAVRFRNGDVLFITTEKFFDGVTQTSSTGEWDSWRYINHKFINRDEWEANETQVRSRSIGPGVPTDLPDPNIWFKGIVRNATDFVLRFEQGWTNSFQFDKAPSSKIMPYGVDCFWGRMAADAPSPASIGAGLAYRIDLSADNAFEIALGFGFNNPLKGPYRVGAVEGSSPQLGSVAAVDSGCAIRSAEYRGVDKGNKPFSFTLRVSAEPGRMANFVIEELRFYNDS